MSFIKSILHIIKSTILAILLICVVIFIINNRQMVTMSLFPLPFEIEIRFFLLLAVTFFLGMLFGLIFCSESLLKKTFCNFKNRLRVKKLERQIKKTEKSEDS